MKAPNNRQIINDFNEVAAIPGHFAQDSRINPECHFLPYSG
jgi:hypothetical protein